MIEDVRQTAAADPERAAKLLDHFKRLLRADQITGEYDPVKKTLRLLAPSSAGKRRARQDTSATARPGWHAEMVPGLARIASPPTCRVLARPIRPIRSGAKPREGASRRCRLPTRSGHSRASEQARESEQRDGGGEFRLLAAEITGCPHQRRRVCAMRAAHSTAMSKNPESFAAANHLPLSPRVSIRSRSICRRSRSGTCGPETGRPIGSSCRWPHAGHNVDRPRPGDRGRSRASHKSGRWTSRRSRGS